MSSPVPLQEEFLCRSVPGLTAQPQTAVPLADCDGFKDDTSGPQLADHPEVCIVAQESVPALVSSAAIELLKSHAPQEMDQKDYSTWLPKGLKHKSSSSSSRLSPPRSASSHKACLWEAGNHQPGGPPSSTCHTAQLSRRTHPSPAPSWRECSRDTQSHRRLLLGFCEKQTC